MIGLHAYSALLFFGLHPHYATNVEKHFMFTLDVKPIKPGADVGVTKELIAREQANSL